MKRATSWGLIGIVTAITLVVTVSWLVSLDGLTLRRIEQLGPMAIALAAVVALVVGVGTVAQKSRADNRAEWWKRAQWALDASMDEKPERAIIGVAVVRYLLGSPLAGQDEAAMLRAAVDLSLDPSVDTAAPLEDDVMTVREVR